MVSRSSRSTSSLASRTSWPANTWFRCFRRKPGGGQTTPRARAETGQDGSLVQRWGEAHSIGCERFDTLEESSHMATVIAPEKRTMKDFKPEVAPDWCAGCGDFGVLNALFQACAE